MYQHAYLRVVLHRPRHGAVKGRGGVQPRAPAAGVAAVGVNVEHEPGLDGPHEDVAERGGSPWRMSQSLDRLGWAGWSRGAREGDGAARPWPARLHLGLTCRQTLGETADTRL
jgi:hypothetical protein